MHVCFSVCGGQRVPSGIIPQELFTFLFETVSPWKLELAE